MVKMNCAIFSLFEDFCDSQNVEFSYALETAMLEFMNSHKFKPCLLCGNEYTTRIRFNVFNRKNIVRENVVIFVISTFSENVMYGIIQMITDTMC